MFVGTWEHDGDIKVDLASLCWVDCAREGNKMWEGEEDTVVNEDKKWELQVAGEQMADECRVIRGYRVYMWGRRRGTWWY